MRHENEHFLFGKFKGVCLADIPVTYLDWFIGKEWDAPHVKELVKKVTEHLQDRDDWKTLETGDDWDGPESNRDDEPDVCPKCAEDLAANGWCKKCEKYPYGKKP